jgi:hypothetical protein
VSLEVGTAGIAVQIVRVEYDVDEAASAIIDSTLPNEFAEYLQMGGRGVSSRPA